MKTRFDEIEALVQNGKMAKMDLPALNLYLQEIHCFSKVNPNFVYTDEVKQVADTIRHLISLKEAENSQRKNLLWTKIGVWAAIAAAVFALIAVIQNCISISNTNSTRPRLTSPPITQPTNSSPVAK
jgi:hypothetical protein